VPLNHDVIKWIFDHVREEPMYVYEIVRKYAREKHLKPEQVKQDVLDSIGYLLEEGRLESVTVWTDPGSEIWKDYRILFDPYHPNWNRYKYKIYRKMERVSKVSTVGKQNAEMFEKAVYQAVKRVFPDAKKTAFNSDRPDVIVPSKKILFEASARFENPINQDYVKRKMLRWRTYYGPDWFIVFISPNITKEAMHIIRRSQRVTEHTLDQEKLMRSTWLQYPKKEGFPIFSSFKYYADVIRKLGRKVALLNYHEAVNDLEKMIRTMAQRRGWLQ